MNPWPRLWFYRVVFLLGTVAVVHLASVWAVPRLIMWRVLHGPIADEAGGRNRAAFPVIADASARRIVMPSPDLLYAICLIDLALGPVEVKADPRLESYWSVALYASNSDSFFVLNDRQAKHQPVHLWLVSDPPRPGDQVPPTGATVVTVPSSEALLLMRVLVDDPRGDLSRFDAARRSLTCQGPQAVR